MADPLDLQTGLVDYWPFDEGSGAVAAGALGVMDLALDRADLRDGSPLPAAAGWGVEPGAFGQRDTYNGGGQAAVPAPSQVNLESAPIGEGVTIAVRIWPEAGRLHAPAEWPFQFNFQGLGQAGVWDSDPVARDGYTLEVADPTAPLLRLAFKVQIPGFWIPGSPATYVYPRTFLDYYFLQGSSVPKDGSIYPPFLLVLTLTRNGVPGPIPDADYRLSCDDWIGPIDIAEFRRQNAVPGQGSSQNPGVPPGSQGIAPTSRDRAISEQGLHNQTDVVTSLAGRAIAAYQSIDEQTYLNPSQAVPRSNGPFVTVRAWINADDGLGPVRTGDDFDYLPTDKIEPDRLAIGCILPSVGGVTIAAYWNRVLEDDEIALLDPFLDVLSAEPPADDDEAGDGTENPLLEPGGLSAIRPGYINPMSEPVASLASSGVQRHTRRTHENAPRVYELAWELASGHDCERVRQAIAITRGGSAMTRWRHPVDDPAPSGDFPVRDAPRWIIRNAGEAGVEFSRTRAGVTGSFRLVLEEVPRD